ncbi:MAG: hypothetical protein ACRD50_09355 [Candidatus Acidiferrales bacterium]
MNHIDEMACLLYLDGQLASENARELSTHVQQCAECGALLRSLQNEERWLHTAFTEEDESVPARLLAPRKHASAPWGWIAAFGFGAAGAYTLWSTWIEPVRTQMGQAGLNEGNLLTMLFFSGAFWKGWTSMLSLMEYAAAAAVGIVITVLLKRHLRRLTTVGMVLGALLAAMTVPRPALAGEVHHSEQGYTLPQGQTVHNDLIVGAPWVTIDGTVDGDLIAGGNEITINGHVTGDVLAASERVRITGQVDGSVRVFAQFLMVDGTVGRNVTSWCNDVELGPKSQVGGGAIIGAGTFEGNGHITRDIIGFVGRTRMNGFTGGNVNAFGGELALGSSAQIQGSTKFEGEHPPSVASEAKLGKPLQFTQRTNHPDYASPRYYWHRLLAFGAAFVLGLAILLLLPGLYVEAVRSSDRYGISLGVGIVALIALPIVAIIACITIVGLGVGIASILLYLVALYSAQIFVGGWLGEKLMGLSSGAGGRIGRLAVGLVIIRAVYLIPYLGGFIVLLVMIWGMGALAYTLYQYARRRPALA